uniref:Na_Ca_ex domain-containing protein n=1 Tax=Heterorhabditis bacteriophora TaxID=37862 RepID=A0A1I7XL08_HETBA
MSKSTCKDGLLIPALEVTHRNSVFYLMALLYCFLGIAIVADIFMCSIERITSAKRKVKRPKNKSEQREVMRNASSEDTEYEEVRIWNPTVANLTLMALGSSAPEILLSTIEIVGNGFKAGELGPGTIVGSAAFNLFCISAICVMAVKSPETKRIAIFNVFIVTAFFGTFAYIWLLIILSLISPNIVEVWEAAATLFLFFVLVVMAYGVDIQGKKATLQEFEMVDEKRPIRLELSSSKYAQHHTIEDGNLGMAPSFETVRTLSRNMARAYPTLSLEEHAKILAYRLNQKVDVTSFING